MSNRYLLFTIIYASVLFLAGISGKFKWPAIDLAVLVLGALTLLAGVAIMIAFPSCEGRPLRPGVRRRCGGDDFV